jgi:hypothetical protein
MYDGFTVLLTVSEAGWRMDLDGLETPEGLPVAGGSGTWVDVPFDYGDFTSGMRVAFTTQGNGGGTLDLARVRVVLETGADEFKRGDANRDSGMNIADAVYILQAIFAQGADILCPDAGDANDDENVNIADAVYILQTIFAQGSPIPPPNDVCGPDPTSGLGKDLPPCDYPQNLCL